MKRRYRIATFAARTISTLALCCVPSVASAQSGRLWRADDRVLVSDFNDVTSVARDNTQLYGITPNGLLIYDLTSHKFRLPLTVEDGYPALEHPLSIAYSPSDFLLLIGTAQGGIHKLNTLASRFDLLTRLPGPVVQLIVPRDGFDVYAASQRGWFRLRGGSFFADPVQAPPRFVQPGANDPYLRTMLGTAGNARDRVPANVVAVEADRTESSFFAATRGNGIVHLNTRSTVSERLPYGLNTRGAGAVASWRGRIWFGGDSRVVAGPLVSATEDLADFRDYPPSSGAPQDGITALLATDSTLWVGTFGGLYAFGGSPGSERWQNFGRAVRTRVTSLTEAGGAVFVGTDRELIRIHNGAAETVLNGRSVYGLAPVRDTLWIASDLGLAAMPLVSPWQASVLAGGGTPREPVFDVRSAGDTLYTVTRDALFRRGPGGWVQPDREVASRLGPLGRLRTDGSSIWVLGTAGFSMKGAQSGLWTYYMAIDDIPEAPVRDLLPLASSVWLATPAGALRVLKPR